jgi:hypothetical protein
MYYDTKFSEVKPMSQATCVQECTEALAYVKSKGPTLAPLVKTIEDCISLCKLNQEFKERGSVLLEQISLLCTEACSRCSQACLASNDAQLKNCIDACSGCAKS